MTVRTFMIASAALILIAGFAAAFISFKRGHLDQAIAFSWPAVSVAVMLGVMAPSRQPRRVFSGKASR